MISFLLGSLSPMIAELDLTSLSSFGYFHELLDPTNNLNSNSHGRVLCCILNLKSFAVRDKQNKFSADRNNGGKVKGEIMTSVSPTIFTIIIQSRSFPRVKERF